MSERGPIRVAGVGFVFDPVAEAVIRGVAPAGLELAFAERMQDMNEAVLYGSDVWLAVAPVTADMLARAERLRFIQKWGTGYDRIDVEAAARRGVGVAITAGANSTTIAEHTLALMLTVLRHVAGADRAVRAGRWDPAALRPLMHGLSGKTVGIVGFGNIGKALTRMLQGFGVTVLYNRRSGRDPEGDALNARFAEMPQLLAESDVVTLHCPGDAANRHMFAAPQFDAMKPGAVFINTARGSLVVEDDLVDALRSGRLLGAGLDVFAEEPLSSGSPLVDLDNVVMTPHVAGGIMDNIAPMARHAFGNILRFFNGEPLDPADVIVPAGTADKTD
ncbi:2-hydroxyacid dehydrogenase [Microbaculum marinum]|uniref:2-hydroxyacid dehydrogenase n=1 Tax=Microbaculum marinum TaxID=1764581 RepID=A0AAW9RH72_9HYPH